jgi:Predicted phosphatase homologous to the C-terminal domain of histone macroH2A1
MTEINYLHGDATQPIGEGPKIIVHICNDIGGWGKGFVMAISKRWKEPATQYRQWHQSQVNFTLGEVQFVQVEINLWIANLIGQHKIGWNEEGKPPIRYEAVAEGLKKVAGKAMELEATIHMPRMGCGLAGGRWEHIEKLVKEELCEKELNVTVYDYP